MLYLILLTEYVQRLLCSAKQYLITYFTDAENANLLFQRMPSFNAYKCYSNLLETLLNFVMTRVLQYFQ